MRAKKSEQKRGKKEREEEWAAERKHKAVEC